MKWPRRRPAEEPCADGAANPAAVDSLIYVYGVTRADSLAPGAASLVEGLVPGTFIEFIPAGALTAIISRVPVDAFEVHAAEAGDTSALASERVLAHHRVLTNLALFCTVAPMKFGVICRNLPAAINAIASSLAVFERALARIEGSREWRVKLHADVEVCRAAVRATLRQRPDTAIASRASRSSVFLRRKPRLDLDAEVLRDLAARAESVHQVITSRTREAAPDAALGLYAGWNGYAPALILKSAYLVPKDAEASFRQTMADLGEALHAEGCTLDMSGPWPPYSFASVDIGNPEHTER